MALDLIQEVYDLISSDAALCINLALWDFGDGVYRPAIFTVDPPSECGYPQITLFQDEGQTEFASRNKSLTSVPLSVKLWDNKTGSQKNLLSLANQLYELLNEATITLAAEFEFKQATAQPPALVYDDDGFPGYEIVLTIEYLE